MNDAVAEAVFLAGLPTGKGGKLIPGHTTWADLGPQTQERYRRMARAAQPCADDPCTNRDHYELRA